MSVVSTGTVVVASSKRYNQDTDNVIIPANTTFIVVGITTYHGTVNFISGGTFDLDGVSFTYPPNQGDGSITEFQSAMCYGLKPAGFASGSQAFNWDFVGTGRPDQFILFMFGFYNNVDESSPVGDNSAIQDPNTGASGGGITAPELTANAGDACVASTGIYRAISHSWANLTKQEDSQNGVYTFGSLAHDLNLSGNIAPSAQAERDGQGGGMTSLIIKPVSAGGITRPVLGGDSIHGKIFTGHVR